MLNDFYIQDTRALTKWLEGKPLQFAYLIVLRVALRLLPLIGGALNEFVDSEKKLKNLWLKIFSYLIRMVNNSESKEEYLLLSGNSLIKTLSSLPGPDIIKNIGNAKYIVSCNSANLFYYRLIP
jgi:hypothetical protein